MGKVKIKVEKVKKKEMKLNGVFSFIDFVSYKITTKSYRTSFKLVNDYIRKKTRHFKWDKDKEIYVDLFENEDFREVFKNIFRDYKVVVKNF